MSKSASGACVLAASVIGSCAVARGALYRTITGETGGTTQATVNPDGSLSESAVNYAAIFKPTTPPPSYVHLPWVDTTRSYNGHNSIGFQIDPTPAPAIHETDKAQLRVSHAGDSSDLEFGNKRYLGFAIDIPSATFQPPTQGAVQVAQWWQGSPYTPPLSVTITGGTPSAAKYEVRVYNNATLGNPSSVPLVLGTGTIPLDTWTPFVVMSIMDYSGQGQVKLWQDGTQLIGWTGAVGYDPTTIPYNNPPAGTANPNAAFDVFIGPYREQQSTRQQFFYDEVRWADTFAQATPVPAPEPGAAALCAIGGASALLRRTRRTLSSTTRNTG